MSLALNFPLLDVRPFWLATLLVVANNAGLVGLLRRADAGHEFAPTRAGRAAIAAAGIALLLIAAHAWLAQILTVPLDAQRADMLIVIQLGIRRLLQGHTPYAMYQVPWPATLPYGPVMWAPMIAPHLLHADIRFVTVLAALFVTALCALAAPRRPEWLVVAAAIAFATDVRTFMAIGHTPTYWPLLPIFAWCLRRRRWVAAAVVCGLLIVGRTTMVAVAPALLIAVWQRARPDFGRAVAALGASIALPLLPFAIASPSSLAYAFYGSYQSVIKGFVWTSTDWAQHTIGITGLLLAQGWSRAVEPVQIAAMAVVIALTWARLRRGDDPAVWAACGLLVFSMTTLWPVVYVYFDVFLLFASAALVRTERIPWAASAAAAVVAFALTLLVVVAPRASIDVGGANARPLLYAGFSGDERAVDRDFSWIDGTRAKVLVPSLRRRDAAIRITCQPYIASRGGRQQLTAALNGVVLGAVDIGEGWQDVSFRAPARAWQIGVNELELFLGSAMSPRDAGEGDDRRRLSLAIDRLSVADD